MGKKYKISLFIFRRDLRLDDNTGLLKALENSDLVIPCFIFDPRQVGKNNKYRSEAAIQFMIESLKDLDMQLKNKKAHLYLFYGNPTRVIKNLINRETIDAIFVNRDHTPFSHARDAQIEKLCTVKNIKFNSYGDILLHEPEDIKTSTGKPYQKFTPFYEHAKTIVIRKPVKNNFTNYFKETIPEELSIDIFKKILPKPVSRPYVPGGRAMCSKIIKNLNKFKNYNQEKDYPEYNTTLLSAHNKFGTYSIREIYHAIHNKLGSNNGLIRQLYWRDFFYHIASNYPYVFGKAFNKKFNNIPWLYNKKIFKRWCNGNTGFPIVDAGMRQLNQTGFMHNRVRLIVASFLVKDLHLNWLWGEKYFAQKLVDYDPAVNNGNWQWVASTGCDSQPYFRIFNPWIQQKKYDPDCVYIKRWIPELKEISPALIHSWYKGAKTINNYPLPIIDHSKESAITKAIYFEQAVKKQVKSSVK